MSSHDEETTVIEPQEKELPTREYLHSEVFKVTDMVEWYINHDEDFFFLDQDDRMEVIDAYAHLLKARDLL